MFQRYSVSTSYKLFALSIPIIVQNLVQYIQLQVDMAFLGHYNPLLLSAVGNVIFPYNVYVSSLLAISLGSTILISHCIGSNDIFKAQRYSEVSFFYNTVISLLFFVQLYIFTPAILSWLGTPAAIHAYASDYMRIISFSFLLIGVEYSITSTLQGMGITRHIMYAGIIRTSVNTLLAWMLVFGRLGFPEMGIDGAALATTIANYCAGIYFILVILLSKKLRFTPTITGMLKPEWKIEKENIKIGVPSGLESMLWSFGQIAIIRIVNELDAFSSGLYVLVSRIQAFTFFIYIGIARATMILVGQKIGAGKPEEAVKITYLSLRYALGLCSVMAVVFISMPDNILSIFTYDSKLIHRASFLLNIISITIFPVSVNVIIGNAIRGMKDTKWMLYTQSIGTSLVICISALMIFVFHLNLLGIFLTILLDETTRSGLNLLRFRKGRDYFKNVLKKIILPKT
jgi:putative MATE family efflux protein